MDVITNSSTVIYTYQDSVTQAKELVVEVLKLAGMGDKTPDDVFFYGVFCEDDTYLESENCPDDAPCHTEWRERDKLQKVWLNDIQIKIMKGEMDEPEWMENAAGPGDYDGCRPSSYLMLIPKNEKYNDLGAKIKDLLGSVDADGGMDG